MLVEKNMLYKLYKTKYPTCKTLNDYNAQLKTITVLIEKNKLKNKTYDKTVWEKTSNDVYRLKEKESYKVIARSGTACKWYDAIYYDKSFAKYNPLEGWRSKKFIDREEAFNFLIDYHNNTKQV